MLKFQQDEEDAGQKVLTCFLLPQEAYHPESMGKFSIQLSVNCIALETHWSTLLM